MHYSWNERRRDAALTEKISKVLMDIKNLDNIVKVRSRVRELTAKFPLPY